MPPKMVNKVCESKRKGGFDMKKAENERDSMRCLQCGREILLGKKQVSNGELQAKGFPGYTTRYKTYGAIPWCKECLLTQFEALVTQYGDMPTAMFYLCRIIDYPVISRHFHRDAENAEDFLTLYFRELFLNNKQQVLEGFFSGDIVRERDIPVFVEAEVLDGPITTYTDGSGSDYQEAFKRWGRNHNYTVDDYDDLEQIYKNIVSQNGIVVDDKTGRAADGITDLAIIEAACNLLESRKMRKAKRPEDAKRYYELYDKAMAGQLLRGRDVKDKQIGASLVQDIVKHCEQDGFIEPWDRKIKYPHKKDVVDYVLLHLQNYVGHLCADVFNVHVKRMDKLPKEYKLDGRNDEFAKEDTDFDKQFHRSLEEISDFKSRQHFSDEDYNEDSVDTDADTETDEALFGSAED